MVLAKPIPETSPRTRIAGGLMIARILGLVLATLVACGFTFACGGGNPASSADASTPPADTAGGLVDAATVTDADATVPVDSGMPDMTDSASCVGLKAKKCLDCCAISYPDGFAEFTGLVLPCACTANLCGALDGGALSGDASAGDTNDGGASVDDGGADDGSADDGGNDASVFGEGACAASTCTATSTPSGTCATCLDRTLGSAQSPGPCVSVAAQCKASVTCAPFIECLTSCK
jgi:hypothetical protein